MPASVPAGARESGAPTSPHPLTGAGDSTGPRGADAAPGPWSCDVRWRRQLFLAGTAVGFVGLADRARVTRAEVAFAGEALRAGAVFLAAVPLVAVPLVAFGVTGVAPEPGASTTFSAVAFVLLAVVSTLVSALSATLVARAAVF